MKIGQRLAALYLLGLLAFASWGWDRFKLGVAHVCVDVANWAGYGK